MPLTVSQLMEKMPGAFQPKNATHGIIYLTDPRFHTNITCGVSVLAVSAVG